MDKITGKISSLETGYFAMFNKMHKVVEDVARVVERFEEKQCDQGSRQKSGEASAYFTELRTILNSCNNFLPPELCENINKRSSLANQVVGNGLLLRHILSCIKSHKDLKSIRLINKQWEREASAVLWRRIESPGLVVPLSCPPSGKFYQRPKLGPLQHFHQNIFQWSDYRRFPCGHFRFRRGKLNSPDVDNFLSNYGHCIRHLTLDLGVIDLSILKNVLHHQVRYLTHLTFLTVRSPSNINININYMDLEKNLSVKFDYTPTMDFPSLPNLQCLSLPFYNHWKTRDLREFCPIVAELLKAGTNLKLVKAVKPSGEETFCSPSAISIYWVREFLAAKRLDLLLRLRIDFHVWSLNLLEDLVSLRNKPRLLYLYATFPDNFASKPALHLRLATAVNALLDGSKETLEQLDGLGAIMAVGPSLSFPVMLNLNSVKVFDNFDHSVYLLPIRTKMDDVFPNLKELSLGHPKTTSCTGSIFIDSHGSTNLQKLTVASHYINYDPPLNLEKAGQIYPNLKILCLGILMDVKGRNFAVSCETIWKCFPNLDTLSLDCTLFEHAKKKPNLVAEYDSAVTGVDVETCREMVSWLEQQNNGRTVKLNPQEFDQAYVKHKKQLGPSIKNLTKLREFRVKTRKHSLFFSEFSTVYAFEPMNLRVVMVDRDS